MFNDLFMFEKRRTGTEAVGFYLFYLFVIIVTGALSGLIFATDFDAGVMLGRYLAIALCLGLSFLVLIKKRKLQNFGLVIVALLSGVGAYLLGGFLGLAVTAYLSTVESEQ